MRQNQLIGYGLVVGLNGTGDTLNNIPFTKQSLHAMLERLGVNIRGQTIRTGNVAAVMVTANLPAFGTQGTRIDVTVSALGDAKSLQGGTLLVTPLLGADGNVYAVAQGSLAIGGFQAEGEAAKITRGVPTVGRIANGAIDRARDRFRAQPAGSAAAGAAQPRLHHRQAHRRRDQRLHRHADRRADRSVDRASSRCRRSRRQRRRACSPKSSSCRSSPTCRRKIVIDERSGVIVMGRDVRVSTVAVAQGNLTVTVSETPRSASRCRSRAAGREWCRARSIGVQEDGKKLCVVREGVSLQQLVDGLNALGIGPRDLITILQAIKAAGAIQADIEVM